LRARVAADPKDPLELVGREHRPTAARSIKSSREPAGIALCEPARCAHALIGRAGPASKPSLQRAGVDALVMALRALDFHDLACEEQRWRS
jgi:hypothetical protein